MDIEMKTNTEYLRGVAENEKWPAIMREQIRLAADEIDALRVEVSILLEFYLKMNDNLAEKKEV